MGLFDDFTNILLLVVAVVIVLAMFERAWIVRQAKRKRERQDREHSRTIEP